MQVVIVDCPTTEEPVLGRLRHEYMQALLEEHKVRIEALTAVRASCAESWGYELETTPIVVEPIEVAPPGFEAKRGMAEASVGSSLRKFFAR